MTTPWVYYSAQIAFFSAEFTKVHSGRFGAVVPETTAVRLTAEARAAQGLAGTLSLRRVQLLGGVGVRGQPTSPGWRVIREVRRAANALLATDGEGGAGGAAGAARPGAPRPPHAEARRPRVLRALRADPATASLPVCVLSNASRESDVSEIHRLGVAGYFVKANLSLQELGDQVVRLLEG